MKLDLDNPAHIKICLLSEGIKIDPSFFKHFTDKYMHNYYLYQKDNKLNKAVPNHLIISKDVCCGLNIDETSSWTLNANNKEFFIRKSGKLITKVVFPNRPNFYNKELKKGVFGKDISAIYGASHLSFFINDTCFFWDCGLPCKFCGYKPTRKVIKNKYLLTPLLASKLTTIALKEMPEVIKCIFFVGGTYQDFDYGFNELFDYLKSIKKVVGNKLPIEVMNFPPANLDLIKTLKSCGAHGIDFCIEIANEKLFKDVCPGKHKYYGHEKFIRAAITASKYFKKRVFLNFVLGLDKKNELIDFLWKIARKGIMNAMNVFYPAPHSLFRDKKRPSVEYIYDVVKEQQKIFKKYKTTPFFPGSNRHSCDYEAFKQMI